jgi:hypothetical protein
MGNYSFMKKDYLARINSFTVDNLPDLDEVVLGSLQFLSESDIPKLDTGACNRPLVIGSDNAYLTGQIIFRGQSVTFADTANYEGKLKQKCEVDGVYIISASGSKHAIEMVERAKKTDLAVFLMSNNPVAPAAKKLEDENVFIFPRIREPYTYNTSTYMSMMLGADGTWSAIDILEYIEYLVTQIEFECLIEKKAFTLILPSELDIMKGLLVTKFDELFGPKLVGRAFNLEQIKHAKTVIRSEQECFISFGVENECYGYEKNRLFVPLPKNCTPAAFLAIGYFVVGQIQKRYPPYFKDEIVGYTELVSKIFGQKIRPIVE